MIVETEGPLSLEDIQPHQDHWTDFIGLEVEELDDRDEVVKKGVVDWDYFGDSPMFIGVEWDWVKPVGK